MTVIITAENSQKQGAHHTYSCEASDIGLRPGEWPFGIKTTLGTRMPLIKSGEPFRKDGEVVYYTYRQEDSPLTLLIYND